MLRNEVKATLKYGLRTLYLLILPIIAVVFKLPIDSAFNFITLKAFPVFSSPPEHIFALFFILFFSGMIMTTAGILSMSSFRAEHIDSAFEYLFTFPISRNRIILNKLLPRIILLTCLMLIYEILAVFYIIPLRSIQGPLFFLIDPLFFPVAVIFIFFSGFFLGIYEQKNWGAVVSLTTLYSLGITTSGIKSLLRHIGASQWEPMMLTGLSFFAASLLILVAIYLAAVSEFRRMDVRSLSLYTRRFAIRALLPLSLVSISSIVILLI